MSEHGLIPLFQSASELPLPAEPLRVAMIGAGNRSTKTYLPLIEHLKPWVRFVAVCDPVREHAQRWAESAGVTAFADIRDLVRARPMEAAFIVTPIESHHSISVFLSRHGIHHHVETTWASTFCQAREMVATAQRFGVVIRVAENFLRLPCDRFAQTLRDSGYLGSFGRIFCYNDHTGFHNNSRWITFARARPHWVQCLTHQMKHPPFYSRPQRRHAMEEMQIRFFQFPDLGVLDITCGHGKGYLGRQSRPGHLEWHGSRGALFFASTGAKWGENLRFEIRRLSDTQFAPAQEAMGRLEGGGMADQVMPVKMGFDSVGCFRVWCETKEGVLEYRSPFRFGAKDGMSLPDPWSGIPVLDHVVDFALAVRGLRPSEFTDEDALASQMMEAGARESALREGSRIHFPIEGDLQTDAVVFRQLREKYGVDPLDVEAMLSISYPPP